MFFLDKQFNQLKRCLKYTPIWIGNFSLQLIKQVHHISYVRGLISNNMWEKCGLQSSDLVFEWWTGILKVAAVVAFILISNIYLYASTAAFIE